MSKHETYRARTPQNLALTKILQKISKRGLLTRVRAGADPEFPIGVGANPPGRGANLRFCQKIPKKLHEIENIFGCVGGGGDPPLDPPLAIPLLLQTFQMVR